MIFSKTTNNKGEFFFSPCTFCKKTSLAEWFYVSHIVPDPPLTLLNVRTRSLAAEPTRIRQRGGNQRTLVGSQFARLAVEVLLSHGLYAIDAWPRLDAVEIDLHDAFLRPEQFDEHGEIGFQALAHPRATRPEKDVLGRLLRDGRCAMCAFRMAGVMLGGSLDGFEVETVMLGEACILSSHDSHGHLRRHLVQRHPCVTDLRVFQLEETDEHERRVVNR